MPNPRRLSPPPPKGTVDDQIPPACDQLRLVLDNLSAYVQDNIYLREVNAKLNGETLSPPPDYSDGNGGRLAAEREARKLLLKISVVTNDDGDEKGLKRNELLELLKKSFEEMESEATQLYVKNEEWREKNEDAEKKSRRQQRGDEEGEPEKKGDGKDRVYQDINDDNAIESTTLPENSVKRYNRLCSAQDKALTQLQHVLDNFDRLGEENRYLRRANAELNGDTLYHPLPPDYNEVRVLEARKLMDAFVPNDEDGLEELIRKLKKSFEEIDYLAAELFVKNEERRGNDDYLYPNWVQLFEQARKQLEGEEQEKKRKGKGKGKGKGRYQKDRDDVDTSLPPEEELEETYEELCSAQVRAFDDLTCLLVILADHIQENRYLRSANAELNGDPSPSPPYDDYKEAEAAAEEAKQLLLKARSRVPRSDEQQDLAKLVQSLQRKFEEIGSLTADVIGKNEEWKVMNEFLREYGLQGVEEQLNKKEVVMASGPAPRDQDRNEDDLREENRFLQAKLQAMEAAMKNAGKTTRAAPTPVLSSLGNTTTSKEVENVQLMKAATASPHHHLPCDIEPELKDVRASPVVANARIGELETARPASLHHLPCPIIPELEKERKALVAANVRIGELEENVAKAPSTKELENVRTELVEANVRIGELEKQIAEEPTRHIPSRPFTPPLPPPKLKTVTVGSSAALVAANERILELEKQLAGAIVKTTNANVGKSHSSPSPTPEENVESSSPTPAPATTLPLVSKAAVDPGALCPTKLFIRRADLPSSSSYLEQQAKLIDAFKPPKHPSNASSSPPNDPPATKSLYFPRSVSERLRWSIWFFILLMMLVGVFLCWIEWARLNRERTMWLGANEDSRMEVEGEIAKAWKSWDRIGIVFCFDRGLSMRLLKLLLSRRGGGGILFVS